MTSGSPPPAPTQDLWRYHRHIRIDQFTIMVAAIVDAELDKAGDHAARQADTEFLYLDGPARARHITQAVQATEAALADQATAAIEHYVAALEADIAEQRRRHIRTHGCHQSCRELRGRT